MRVLLVDDEKELLEQAKLFLENDEGDFDIEIVTSPDKALDKIKEGSFDAVVSDYQMPKMDGLEFLRIIREEREIDIPFVMFTGKGREKVAMEALNLGADRYIQKGGEPHSQYDVLTDGIKQEIEHYQKEKELKKSEKEKSLILDSTREIIAYHDKNQKIKWANEAYKEATGLSNKEIEDEVCTHAWNLDEFCENCPVIKAMNNGEPEEAELTPENQEHWSSEHGSWLVRASPVKDDEGRVIGAIEIAHDITDRKKAEKALKKREKKYKNLFYEAPVGILHYDDESVITEVNEEFVKFMGSSKESLIGFNMIEDLKNQGVIDAVISSLEKGEGVYEGWYTSVTGGEKRYGRVLFKGLEDESGEINSGIGIVEDLSDKKEREERIKNLNSTLRIIRNVNQIIVREENLKDMMKSSCEGIKEKGTIQDCSIALLDEQYIKPYVGDFENIITKKWAVDQDGKGNAPNCIKKAVRSKEIQLIDSRECGDCEYKREDKDINCVLVPMIRNDVIVGLLIIEVESLKDITSEEKELLEEVANDLALAYEKTELKRDLEMSKEKYKNLFYETPLGTFHYDENGVITECNDKFVEVIGSSKEALIGLDMINDLEDEELIKEVKFSLTEGKGFYEGDYSSVTADKTTPVRVIFKGIRNEDGEIYSGIGLVEDITEQKEKEKELQDERNFLEQIAEMSPVCITKLNAEGEIIYANDRAEDVLGLSKSEIKGRTYNDVKWNITDDKKGPFPEEKLPFKQVKKKGEPVYGIKHGIEWPNGEWKLLSINASPLYDEDGNFNGMVASIEDITEKERREKKLKESRRRLKTLMDNIPGMAYRCKNNKNWTMNFISDGCIKLTGYQPEELIDDEVLPYREVIHPEDRDYVWNKIQNSVEEGDYFKLEYKIRTKSGKIKWVWEKGIKINIDGEEYLEGIITDITERKEIEEELKKSEEKYKKLFYETPLGTFYHDETGVITDCNQKFVDMIGSSKDDLIGFNIINQLEDEELLKEVKSSSETGEGYYEGEYESITVDKTTPVRVLLKGMKDDEGNIYAGLGLVEDITEQKEKEEEVEKEKERYEILFEENPEALVEVDEELKIIKANSQFEKLFKYNEKEILGRDLDNLVVPDDKMDEAKDLNKRSKREGYFDHETVRVDKYGDEVHVAITGRPIKHDEKTHHIAVYRDISERKQAQSRENFLHSLLRHDVRNKAQLIKGYLNLLEESCESEIQEEYIDKASKTVREAEEIINKVSKLRKIEREEDIKEVDLAPVLDNIQSEIQRQLKENNIEIDIEKSRCEVEGGLLLEELFYNIIENSIKHSKCDNIKVRTLSNEDECIVSIEDDGKGIPNRYKDRVFKKGFKKGKTAGSGLGMYMVKEIAENYDGSIEVKDSDLGGARFDVHLKRVS